MSSCERPAATCASYQAFPVSSMNCQAPPKSSTVLSPYVDALPGTRTQSLTAPATV